MATTIKTNSKNYFNKIQKYLNNKRVFFILLLIVTLAAQAQRQQISYIEETKNWYYVYDEQGKRIGGLSRNSVGELKG